MTVRSRIISKRMIDTSVIWLDFSIWSKSWGLMILAALEWMWVAEEVEENLLQQQWVKI
jgi:hypothetical protein